MELNYFSIHGCQHWGIFNQVFSQIYFVHSWYTPNDDKRDKENVTFYQSIIMTVLFAFETPDQASSRTNVSS